MPADENNIQGAEPSPANDPEVKPRKKFEGAYKLILIWIGVMVCVGFAYSQFGLETAICQAMVNTIDTLDKANKAADHQEENASSDDGHHK